jgi:hypothetical protein
MTDLHKNFAYSLVATAPSPATSGTSLVVTTGQGALFPTPPFNATVWAANAQPTTANAEIVRVTNITSDTLTITRAQETSLGAPSARSIVVGDQIAATITAQTLVDAETNGANVTLSNLGTTAINAQMNLAVGTTGLAPLSFGTSGALLSSVTQGAIEYDGKQLYATPIASHRGVLSPRFYSIVPSGGFAMSTGTGACFPTTGDVWTLPASTTYFIEGFYSITKSGTTCTTGISFVSGGGGSLTSILYQSIGAVSASGTAQTTILSISANNTVVIPTGSVACFCRFSGLLRTNAAGTFTPTTTFSAVPTTPTMNTGSYLMLIPLGTDTTNIMGNVG